MTSDENRPARRSIVLPLLLTAAVLLLAVAAWTALRVRLQIAWNWNAAMAPVTDHGGNIAWHTHYLRDGATTAEEAVACINFDNKPIGDAEVEQIVDLYPNLINIQLGNTQISDAALEHLENRPGLTYVKLDGTRVSVEAVQSLANVIGVRVEHPTEGWIEPEKKAEGASDGEKAVAETEQAPTPD